MNDEKGGICQLGFFLSVSLTLVNIINFDRRKHNHSLDLEQMKKSPFLVKSKLNFEGNEQYLLLLPIL